MIHWLWDTSCSFSISTWLQYSQKRISQFLAYRHPDFSWWWSWAMSTWTDLTWKGWIFVDWLETPFLSCGDLSQSIHLEIFPLTSNTWTKFWVHTDIFPTSSNSKQLTRCFLSLSECLCNTNYGLLFSVPYLSLANLLWAPKVMYEYFNAILK